MSIMKIQEKYKTGENPKEYQEDKKGNHGKVDSI